MYLHPPRILVAAAATAFLVAGCGQPHGPNGAERAALRAIAGSSAVESYPIPAADAASYLPGKDTTGLGSPIYIFALRRAHQKRPGWVVAGPKGAHVLQVFPNIADLLGAGKQFPASYRAPLAPLAKGPLGKMPLQIVGLRLRAVSGKKLQGLGLQLSPSASYTVVSVLSVPKDITAQHLEVANFVFSNGRLVGQYGTSS